MDPSLTSLLTMLGGQVPYFAVWLVGLILALVNWSKYPRPALLTLVAVILLFGASLGHGLAWYVIMTDADFREPSFRLKLTVLAWVRTIIVAVSYGLLFCAVFGWRAAFAPVRRRPPDEDDEDAVAEPAPDGGTDIRTSRRRDRE
jgi:hypothetical protein